MTMTYPIATLRISSRLSAAEVALDEALLKQSELMSTLLVARLETGVAPFTGQEQLIRLVKAQQAITSSSNDLARVHGGMLKIGREIGLIDDCPEPGEIKTGTLAA